MITGGSRSSDVFLRGLVVGGSMIVNLPGSNGNDVVFGTPGNEFVVSSSAASVTTVNGNFYYTSGPGAGDTVDLRGGVMHGNVFMRLGGGTEMVLMATFGGTPTVVGGNLTVVAGNGDVTMPDNSAQIGGTASFFLGNGNDSLSFSGAQTNRVNALFGNGDDTFTLNNAAAVLTGQVVGGSGANVFDQLAGTIGSPFRLVNF
jgi:hypothetical protein